MIERQVTRWILLMCALILGMVTVGGITRLTQSGLSMVDWHLFMDMVPPFTEAQWAHKFEQYKAYPQYQQVNWGMTLESFKSIFFWEYVHRMYGRVIGLVFMIPLGVFLVKRTLPRWLAWRLTGAFGLLCLQGAVGWFMVKSGLVDRPSVSHFRLALHLGMALTLLAYLAWLAQDLLYGRTARAPGNRFAARAATAILGLLSLQILFGAFVAGLKAGYGFNTFPTMNGEWIPLGIAARDGFWANLLDNPVAVQFTHRWLGIALFSAVWGVWFVARKRGLTSRARVALHALAGSVTLQFLLGIATLLLVVPIPLAVAHQGMACVVLLSAVAFVHAGRA